MPRKIKLIEKLRNGQSITGMLDEVENARALFQMKDESYVSLPVSSHLMDLLDDGDYLDEIITVTNDSGDFIIEKHDEWPESKPAK